MTPSEIKWSIPMDPDVYPARQETWVPITEDYKADDAYNVMREALDRVVKRVGYTGSDIILATDRKRLGQEPAFYMEVRPGWYGPTMYYVKGATAVNPIERIEASMAHEIGHIVHGDIYVPKLMLTYDESRRMELEADKFAAKHGYGEHLKTFLGIVAKHPQYTEGLTHPKLAERIKVIEEASHATV